MKVPLANFLSGVLLVMACTAHAEPKQLSEYQKCMDKVDLSALKNSQWSSCAQAELKRLDVELNKAYQALRGKLDTDQKEALKTAQLSWLKYRENWCHYESVSPFAPGGDTNYDFCMVELTTRQVETLSNMAY